MNTDQAIKERRTFKVIAPEPWPPSQSEAELKATIHTLLKAAGCAPFRYACDEQHQQGTALKGKVPRRFHVLDTATTRKVAHYFKTRSNGSGTLLGMLYAADATILTTWLPDPMPAGTDPEWLFYPSRRNMDHIAGAAAAVQNLLLAATDLGLETTWSSGGHLQTLEYFDLLGIPKREILLGALFIFPRDIKNADVAMGDLRPHRGEPSDWSRFVTMQAT